MLDFASIAYYYKQICILVYSLTPVQTQYCILSLAIMFYSLSLRYVKGHCGMHVYIIYMHTTRANKSHSTYVPLLTGPLF